MVKSQILASSKYIAIVKTSAFISFVVLGVYFIVKMPKSRSLSRKSLKRSISRKVSQFKAGHPQLKSKSVQECTFNSKIVPELNSLTSISRINSNELPDVLLAASRHRVDDQTGQPGVLPYKLRPGIEKDYAIEKKRGKQSQCQSTDDQENIIVNIKKLEELFNGFFHHTCNTPSVSISVTERQGLCVSVTATCNSCMFKTRKTDLFTKIKTKRGPDAGCLNISVLLPVTKSRIGINDLNLVLSCLNIRAPDKRGLQRKLNNLSDRVENMNKQQMVANQQYVKKIQTLAGVPVPNESDIEFDVSFSSRPQQGCESATQSFAPILEQTTTRHLPISIQTASKLCTRQTCTHNNEKCKRNYNITESIQSTEPKLLKKNLDNIQQQSILKIRSVTTDASAQIAKAIRDYNTAGNFTIRHYKCFIHRMRSLHKQLKNLRLTSVPKDYDRNVYSQKLASCLRARARLELTRFRKRFTSDDQYVEKARLSMENMIPCFQGDHKDCRQKSMVCSAHLPTYTTKFLPYGKYLEINITDIDSVLHVLGKYLSPECLKEMAQLSSTNQCESLHSKLFTYAPKHTVWSRNFSGLCHSVAHSASLGTGASLLQTAKMLGLPVSKTDPFYQYMEQLDTVSKFHTRRQTTYQYKTLRHVRRKQKCNRKLLKFSVYGENIQINEEHDYGINPNL